VSEPGRGLVTWLAAGKAKDALVELAEPGRLILRSREEAGAGILTLLKAAAGPDSRALADPEVVLAITERFLIAKIDGGARVHMSERVNLHLGFDGDPTGKPLYQVCFPDRVELWSEQHRAREHERLSGYVEIAFSD
jgi:hypothetical protein